MYQPLDRDTADHSPLNSNKSQQPSQIRPVVPDHGVASLKPKKTFKRPTKRLSLFLKFSLVISLLFLAGAVAFISWLWWAPHQDVRWRKWVLAPNRLQLSITLSAVVIRTAIGILATAATAMIASAAVERRGVYLQDIAQVSVARFSSDGPLSLSLLALTSSSLQPLVRLVLALLAITTIAAQFTSTLLVADLEQRRVVAFADSISNAYTFIPGNHSSGKPPEAVSGYAHNYWIQRPRLTETFAEYTGTAAEGEGLDDTGPTVRAFLPVASQQERESLLEFQGMARVLDTRFICMRPQLSNVRPCNGTDGVDICGSIRLDPTVDAAAAAGLTWTDEMNFNFSCPVTGYMGNRYDWQICAYETLNWTSFDWSLRNTTRMTTMRIVWDAGRIQGNMSSDSMESTVKVLSSTGSGPWTRESLHIRLVDSNTVGKDQYINFNMTMCAQFYNYPDSIQYLNVSATSSSNRTEPTYDWDVEREVYDTSAVRRQLGAVRDPSSLSHDDRQVLTISKDNLDSAVADARDGSEWQQYAADRSLEWFFDRVTYARMPSMPIAFCHNCAPNLDSQDGTSDVIYERLFGDTIDETGSPARAMQAVYFTLARLVYYDFLSAFSPNTAVPGMDTADVVTFELTSIPWRFRGYLAVVGIILVFLASFAAAAVLFRSTRYSLPENAWHTVAQISESPELADLLHDAKVATDGDVGRLAKASKSQRFVVRDGVFTQASGAGLDVELESNQSRRRLTTHEAVS
ncbi:uncharacterized protein CCOS01_07313 [Colletotrichum costaricense]|uniref:Uncharacterized protein n=1 Tax=Colletotrichum costaricense TaxID=1209916 RepID=A0AAI9YWR6_9PEZI|nr:uncharacterized protein CCOS01_07313 [Colletotrichum costaricense]KAK1527051.1 hypothetical protein CCOS01_07313 [Colletotrichum costaricense]